MVEAAAIATATPEEQIDAARGVLHAALKAELLQRVLAQSSTGVTPSTSWM